MDLFPEIDLEGQIKCVQREISMREGAYPRFVANKKMTQDRADYEIRAMKSVLATLEKIRRHNAAVRNLPRSHANDP